MAEEESKQNDDPLLVAIFWKLEKTQERGNVCKPDDDK
jgi:hypothetical protein